MTDRSIKPDGQEPAYSKSDPSDLLYKQMRNDDPKISNLLGYNEFFVENSQTMPIKTESSTTFSSGQSMDVNSRVGFSNQASEYRKAFYHFQRMIQSSEQKASQYNLEFQKNLNIKTQNILDLKGMSDYFERQLFKLARNPKQVRKNWSEDETLLLLSIMAYFCSYYNEDFMNLNDKVWDHLATMYPGKTPEQLKLRWHNVLKVPLNKTPWTKKEDEMLEEVVSERGGNHWREIAMELHSRSGSVLFRQSKQCRERWTNHLDPSLKKGSWSNKEDVILLKGLLQKGKKWSEIAKMLSGRTENSVKNRWVSLLKKYKSEMTFEAIRMSEEYQEEDELNAQIAKALIEIKERNLSAQSSEDEQSLFSVEKIRSDDSEEKKLLSSNLKNQEFAKQNKFISDKIQESFNKKLETTTDPFFSQNTSFVPQDSFKDLIEWQKGQDSLQPQEPTQQLNQQHMFQQTNQQQMFQQPTQQQQMFQQPTQQQQLFQQQQQFQQMPQQQNQFYQGGQNAPLFSNVPQNMINKSTDQNQQYNLIQDQQYQNKDSMFFNQGQNQGSFNMNPYPMPQMMPYPMQYNNYQQPQNYPYYPGNYGMDRNAPYYQQGPFTNNAWGGMPMYNPNYNMNQPQFPQQYSPQFQPQSQQFSNQQQQQFSNQQQFPNQQQQFSNQQQQFSNQQQQQYPNQQQQPQFEQQMQLMVQNQFQAQMQPQLQSQPQLFQQTNPNTQNQAQMTEPKSNYQLREMPISSLMDNNSGNPNPNYHLAMVNINKNEIFFMNQANQNNIDKTIEMTNNQPTIQTNNMGGSADSNSSRLDESPKKFDKIFYP